MATDAEVRSPRDTVNQITYGMWIAQAARAMVALRLADHLAAQAHTVETLAVASDTHAPTLARLVRALSALGLCARDAHGNLTLTPAGELLRSDVAGSHAAFVEMVNAPWMDRAWEELPAAVRSGTEVFTRVHGIDMWRYLAAHPEDAAGFDAAMTGGATRRGAALLNARDLSAVGTIVDVGGGQGQQLAALLSAVPSLRGILVDRPEVVADAGTLLEAAGVADRCEVVGGDFFELLPRGGDAYVLSAIIHDWPDMQARAILRRCHEAMMPGKRVWLIENVLASNVVESVNLALIDLNMLVLCGAQERTEEEFRMLLEEAGFVDVAVHPTNVRLSVIEGVRP